MGKKPAEDKGRPASTDGTFWKRSRSRPGLPGVPEGRCSRGHTEELFRAVKPGCPVPGASPRTCANAQGSTAQKRASLSADGNGY